MAVVCEQNYSWLFQTVHRQRRCRAPWLTADQWHRNLFFYSGWETGLDATGLPLTNTSPSWSTVYDFCDNSCVEYILQWSGWNAVTPQNAQGVQQTGAGWRQLINMIGRCQSVVENDTEHSVTADSFNVVTRWWRKRCLTTFSSCSKYDFLGFRIVKF